MTNNSNKLNSIFTALFGSEAASLADSDGMTTIAAWDSASQLDLIMAIEAEFEVQFDVDDFAELTSVGAIRAKLQQLRA